MVMEFINLIMVNFIKVIGKITKCMVKVKWNGLMVKYIKENFMKIKDMAKEN